MEYKDESVAVIVPVYGKPKRVDDIIRKILACEHPNCHVTVIVDGFRNDEIDAALAPWEGRIRLLRNDERLGKPQSLMKAVAGLEEDLLLFIDNDIILPDDSCFIEGFLASMKDADIANFPTDIIGKGILPRMMRMEFLGIDLTQLILSKIGHHSPAVIGMALGIRRRLFEELGGFRRIICEDLDLGARAFHAHARFAFESKHLIRSDGPETFGEWMNQRKRWAVNNIVWFNEHFFRIIKHAFGSPRFFLSAIMLFLPTIVLTAVFLGLRDVRMGNVLPLIYLVIGNFSFSANILYWISHFNVFFFDGILPTLGGLLISELLYFGLSMRFRVRFNPLDFILYYFVYSPILIVANVVAWFIVILRIDIGFDWKV
ncbi:MAG TPA: glycosyltransferase family 2 protein [Rectinemataceae bacterium]|nr:glycosyltransferase family 2 protein [Rectinemataceae bacterium]